MNALSRLEAHAIAYRVGGRILLWLVAALLLVPQILASWGMRTGGLWDVAPLIYVLIPVGLGAMLWAELLERASRREAARESRAEPDPVLRS